MGRYTIRRIDIWLLDIPITHPFVVATGQRTVAENAVVRVTLENGAAGYGEMAPFPEVGGERRSACLKTAAKVGSTLLGRPATDYRRIAYDLLAAVPAHPAVRCGLETAVIDALCRELGIPLWGFWGGADVRVRETDITIPITTVDHTLALAHDWYFRGFRQFKTKVGADTGEDIQRLTALHRTFSDIAIIADANQGFTERECRTFLKEIRDAGVTITLLEQPVPREDLDGLAALKRDFGIPIAADESVRSLEDVMAIIRHQAADVINIKIMKSGLHQTLDIAMTARAAGLDIMAGGMVETRLAMGCSFAVVLGFGGCRFLDLDTPLLLADDPIQGGYRYAGPMLHPWTGPGLDVTVQPEGEVRVLE